MTTGLFSPYAVLGLMCLVAGCSSSGHKVVGPGGADNGPLFTKMLTPVAGVLAASDITPTVGQSFYVYLNVTALDDIPDLTVTVTIPDGLKVTGNHPVSKAFGPVDAGATVTVAIPLELTIDAGYRLQARAVCTYGESMVLGKAFLLTLNADLLPQAPSDTSVHRIGSDGRGLRVYFADPNRPE